MEDLKMLQNKIIEIQFDNDCMYDRIIELEKENDELKEKLKNEIAFNEQSETVKNYKAQIEEKECFKQKDDGTIDICEVMKENKELKEMFEIVCKERYGYAWEMRKSDLVEKLKRRIIK